MLGEVAGDAVRLVHMRVNGALALGPRQLLLDGANRSEILVELALIGRAQRAAQRSGIVGDEVEDAATVQRASRLGVRRQLGAIAEQPFKQRARIENRRQRLRLAAPGKIIGVSAGIARITVARLPCVLEPDLEGREARLLADLVGVIASILIAYLFFG